MNKQFLSLSKFLNETKEEYPEFYEEEKSWWKTFKNNFWSQFDMFNMHKLQRLPKEEILIHNHFKNINVEVRLSRHTSLNAFTFPAYESDDPSLMDLGMMEYINKGFRKLMLTPLNKVKSGHPGEVIFPKSDVKFLIFVTKGSLVNYTPQQRLAIYLHEIGHWFVTAKHVPFHMKLMWEKESKAYGGINIAQFLNAYSLYLRRYNEYESDLFSIHAGYGKDLSSGFKFDGEINRKHATWTIRSADAMQKKFIEWHNRAEASGKPAMTSDGEDISDLASSYPSIKSRIDQATQYEKNKEFRKKADDYIESDF